MVMLQCQQLSKRFGDVVALEALDLAVAPREVFCLLGANGAGKTTTINLFLGFCSPTAGTVRVDGIDPAADPHGARARLAYIPEQVNLYPLLTGLENLAYFSRLADRRDVSEAQLLEYFSQAGLAHEHARRPVREYSKGMRQKVGIAIALAKQARALLLDEPLSGLDPQAANELCALLCRIRDAGAAVLLATHDLMRAREVGTRVGIMRAGRLLDVRDTAQLTHVELEQVYLDLMRT
jgi:ABC-2 type transport system ATP-binding protein